MQDVLPSPPTSPLAMRVTRRQEKALPIMASPPRVLERLEEEEEDNLFFASYRPLKRRKTSEFMAKAMHESRTDEDAHMESTPERGLTHSMAADVPIPSKNGEPLRMVLRSTSQKRIQSTKEASSIPEGGKIPSASASFRNPNRSFGKGTSKKIAKGKKRFQVKHDSQRDREQANTLEYHPFELADHRFTPIKVICPSVQTTSSEETVDPVAPDDDLTWFVRKTAYSEEVKGESQLPGGIENLKVGCFFDMEDGMEVHDMDTSL
ncbi:hypothetical protein B0H34DRAFT_522944 [Crassisporium funariophilum]|nr:hypothetical protein B0H34DRAFT_522944 [Crassisporium funariophilum]